MADSNTPAWQAIGACGETFSGDTMEELEVFLTGHPEECPVCNNAMKVQAHRDRARLGILN